MKAITTMLLSAFLLTFPAFGQKIKTIRVVPLVPDWNNNDNMKQIGDMITAKLISHLVKDGVSVIETGADTDADAVLTGNVQMAHRTDEDGITHYRFSGAMRLTNPDGKILWADDVKSSVFAQSASSSFAENIARKVEAFLSSQK